MTTKYAYGSTVIEFFPHDDTELQLLIDKEEARYHSRSEGLDYRGLAANIDWVRLKPLELSLIELQDVLKEGYTIIRASARNLYFSAMLRKPDETVSAELLKVTELAKEEYQRNRYERNCDETQRQIEISVSRSRREAAEAIAAAAAKAAELQQESEEELALADLLRVHSPKAKTKVKQEVAA